MPAEPKEQLEFAWKVHGYTNEYIRFADSKAGVALAVVAGLIAALFGVKAHAYLHPSRLWFVCGSFDGEVTAAAVFTAVAFVLLVVAAVLLVLAIDPRVWPKLPSDTAKEKATNPPTLVTDTGLIFWESVRAHGTAGGYEAAVRTTDASSQLGQVTAHVFVLGDIARRKYIRIRWAIRVGFVAAVATLTALYLMRG